MKKVFCLLLMLAAVCCAAACAEEKVPGLGPGDWAFNHAPETTVLLLREDGTAEFQGKPYSWEDDGTFLRLTEAETEEELPLRYQITEKKTLLWIPTVYRRYEQMPGEDLIGAWVGEESGGSTFIFTEDSRFLEDGTFTGVFRTDPEAGTFLLIYPEYFDDTLCYYRMEGNDILTVEYPWILVETEKDPSTTP